MRVSRAAASWIAWSFMLAVLAPVIAAHGAAEQERPLWELGLGGGVVGVPYYRGSEENQVLPVPFIYPLYRGKVLKVDEEGVRGLFLRSERVQLDFSLDGTVPASGSDVEIRKDMPELDATFQIGPSLIIDLWQRDRHNQNLILTLPLRSVLAVDRTPRAIGLAASPKLTYQRDIRFADRYWRLGFTGGVELGSDKLHDYFYSVDDEFATGARPAYRASGGFAGTRFTLSAQGRRDRTWIGAFIRYDSVEGAVFEDSPLVRRNGNLSAGIVVAWFFARSDETVKVPSEETLRY